MVMLKAQEIANNNTCVKRWRSLVLYRWFGAMLTAWCLVALVLPLRGLFFSPAFQPSHHVPPSGGESWFATLLLLSALVLLFYCYLLALRSLSSYITVRFIIVSGTLLGGICILIPVVTSPDLFSYIFYARMATLYHLNPLVTAPFVVAKDPLYSYLYWKDQPSAYGPTWIALSSLLQALSDLLFGAKNLFATVLLFRLFGLLSHLCSTWLIWSMSGHLQVSRSSTRLRIIATLAFVWNPLLLFEACVNAHNDTVLLLLILLSLWFLVHQNMPRSYAFAALFLAFATCLKVNAALLFPGLLFFLWQQPRRKQAVSLVALLYCGTVFVLYAPFWHNGAILHLLSVNPGAYRNINSLADFFGQLLASLTQVNSVQIERVTHMLSVVCFALMYILLCWHALFTSHRLYTIAQLLEWMMRAWFLYCLLGAPWFWPWYAVTLFGLLALVQMNRQKSRWTNRSTGNATYILAFCLLSSYCFFSWGVYNSFAPWLIEFRWAYLRGAWVWLPVLLVVCFGQCKKNTHDVIARKE